MNALTLCPCCHQPARLEGVVVSLDINTVSTSKGMAHLTPMQAEVLYSLVSAWPRSVPKNTLIQNLWGVIECEVPEKSLDAHFVPLRRKIAPLGLRIDTIRGWKAASYRLEKES
jgi:DNA-binding response OmpR family regulator